MLRPPGNLGLDPYNIVGVHIRNLFMTNKTIIAFFPSINE